MADLPDLELTALQIYSRLKNIYNEKFEELREHISGRLLFVMFEAQL